MGKSPGKWIKTLFSGKKSSKSNPSSKRNNLTPSSNQDVLVSSEASLSYIPVDSSLISPATSGANGTKDVLSEKVEVSRSSNERVILSAGDEETDAQAVVNSCSQDDVENIRLAQAAIKAQAAFRGYQARRKFQTLKGIIQLQALIRGHLVRRQAVSTLYCVKGIVKFQALVRGHKVRHSDIGIAVLKIRKDTKCPNSIGVTTTQAEKLSKSVFVRKLLASSSSTVSLHLNFDPGELNFAWEWLDRWTRSLFWEPLPELKKKLDLVSDEKSCSCQTFENNECKVKRNAQKASGVKVDDGSISDPKKYKLHQKKVSGRPIHSSQEHSQKEIKSNIKLTSVQSVSNRSETANEKRKHITGKLSGCAVTDVSKHGSSVSAEKMKNLVASKSNRSDLEKSLGQQAEDEHDKLHDNPISGLQTSENNVRDEVVGGASEDLNRKVNSKNSLRRASLPANFGSRDNGAHNTPKLPSYMAPTESAKAKLRAQGSPRFATDLLDKNGITRRLSLSSSFNGKLGSFSPRAERLLAISSRGLIRTDRSLLSSRDGTEKLIQPQWRR